MPEARLLQQIGRRSGANQVVVASDDYIVDMMDKPTPKHRSWVMSRIRSKDAKQELAVRSMLHRCGYRFSLRRKGCLIKLLVDCLPLTLFCIV